MATAEQLKALLKSYVDGNGEQFLTVSMQVAAHAARKGNQNLARELRELIDEAKRRASQPALRPAVPMARAGGDLSDLVAASYPKTRLVDMVLAEPTRRALEQVVVEYRQQDKLRSHGLSARRKLLLVGSPGVGKTMTAAALAGELSLPLLAVRLDGIITKYMGETAAKIRQVFDAMSVTRGVYLFDEFDAIGGDRKRPNDVGEIRRVLNSFLQFVDADESDSLILAATNHQEILDPALFRRFDDVVRYGLPTSAQVQELVKNLLNSFTLKCVHWKDVCRAAEGLSHAEIARAAMNAAKAAVLADRDEIKTENLLSVLEERRAMNKPPEPSSDEPQRSTTPPPG